MNGNRLNSNDNNNDTSTYKATSNLNTAIENPQINVNSATSINIQGLNNNDNVDTNNDYIDNSIDNDYPHLNNSYNNQVSRNISNDNVNFSTNYATAFDKKSSDSYTYEPVMKEKKMKKDNLISSLFHSKEFKVIIFIIFILCLFLLVMPYIYDFFKNLKMGIAA